MGYEVEIDEDELRERVGPEAFQVLRHAATERPYTGELLTVHDDGTFSCKACGAPLFRTATKYDSGCGWPSFWDSIDPAAIERVEDRSHGMLRVETRCARCGSHLGHVFDDGPQPTGERYCMNSLALEFRPADGA